MSAIRLAPLLLAAVPLLARAHDPVGAETCKACHPAAYAIWRSGPHARAEESLPARSRSDVGCAACHAPNDAQGPGVACEACHGNGKGYARSYVMRDPELARALGLVARPGESSCRVCHDQTAPSLSHFDYARKVTLVRHGQADREARSAPAP